MKLVTDKTFAELATSEKPVLVDFFADWCGPCRILSPILESLSEEMDSVEFVKFDAAQGSTPDAHDVTVLPTLVLFKKGQEVARIEGLLPKPKLVEWLNDNTSS